MGSASNQRVFSAGHGIQTFAFLGTHEGTVSKQRPLRFGLGKRPAAPPNQQRNQLLACKGQELIDARVQAGGQFVQSLL
jgi:hypothetical protein